MRLTTLRLGLLPTTAAAVLLGLGLTRAAAVEDLTLMGAAVAMLALGHAALRLHRQRAAARAEASRMKEQLELRARVGECERRREHLAAFAQLAAHVSHEVRNPLSSITLNLELLDEELSACSSERAPVVRQLLGSVQAEAARLQRLTDEYLAFARPRHPAHTSEDLGELVVDLVRLVREEALRSGVILSVTPPDAPVRARIDRNQVKQALLNLVRNAVQAMPNGGRAIVGAFEDAGRACISVSDTGPGIPGSDRCRIFDPFFTTKAEGTGLGLPLALHIVREHGGEIRVASGADRGAVFTMSFPSGQTLAAGDDRIASHVANDPIEAAS